MPTRLQDFILCKEFGWTPEELDNADAATIKDFILIIGLREKHKKMRQEQNG